MQSLKTLESQCNFNRLWKPHMIWEAFGGCTQTLVEPLKPFKVMPGFQSLWGSARVSELSELSHNFRRFWSLHRAFKRHKLKPSEVVLGFRILKKLSEILCELSWSLQSLPKSWFLEILEALHNLESWSFHKRIPKNLESPHKHAPGNKACVEPAAASCGPQELLDSRKEMPEDK